MHSEERREVLRMLTEGKISIGEAEILLDALEARGQEQKATNQQSESDSSSQESGFGFNFDFGNFVGKVFDDFGDHFVVFDDAFGGFAKQKNRRSNRP